MEYLDGETLARRLENGAIPLDQTLRTAHEITEALACAHGLRIIHRVRGCVVRAARRGHVQNDGVHVLRHTFCSHLAMRGAPARAIQELAGHANLSATQRYMHLSPAAITDAIRLLDQPSPDLRRGDIVETADRGSVSAVKTTS